MNGYQAMPMTRTVKWLIGVNVAVWFFGILILQRMILHSDVLVEFFALFPYRVLHQFWIWQPFTYMFLHSTNIMHILFNMLVLWWFGSELEMRWGRRFFLTYYFVSGVGAALIYVLGITIYGLITGNVLAMMEPVVGASGAGFGLMVAYGMIFGDRVVSFMMIFPMKAKHFVMILGFIELATLMDNGTSSGVANLAHLGGIISGYLFLQFWTNWRFRLQSSGAARRGRKLKLVVNNEKNQQQPKYWN
jgi:membrane associated rhomboid family serine protease